MIIIGIIMMAICGILVGYLIYLTLTADIFRWIYGRIFLKPRTIEKIRRTILTITTNGNMCPLIKTKKTSTPKSKL